jgi:hypothetical protein
MRIMSGSIKNPPAEGGFFLPGNRAAYGPSEVNPMKNPILCRFCSWNTVKTKGTALLLWI